MAKTTPIDHLNQSPGGLGLALDPDPDTPLDLNQDGITGLEELEGLEDPEGVEGAELDPKPPLAKRKNRPKGLGTGGRPRADGILPGLAAPTQPKNIPHPRFVTYKSDSVNPAQRPKAAFTWWGGLPEWAKNKVLGYVYRDWPVLKPPPEPVPGERKSEFAYIDKLAGTEPLGDELDLLNRYGCGRYRIILNEEDQRPGGGRTLATIHVTGLGNEMRSFPPADRRVSDIEQVDLTHPDNRAYVEFLRMRGLLPEQRSTKDEENEMATATAVSEMAGLVNKLVDSKTNDAGLTEQAVKGIIDMTQKGATATIESYRDSMRDAEEIRKKARDEVAASVVVAQSHPQAPAADPFDQAIKIVTLMNGAKGNDDILAKFMEQSNKQMERLEAMVKENMNRPQLQPTPIVDRIKDLKDLREISRDLFGEKEESGPGLGDVAADAAGDMAPKWLRPFVPMLVPLVTGIAQAFMSRPGPVPVQQQQPYPYPYPGYPPNQYPPPVAQYPPAPVQFPNQGPAPVQIPPMQPQAQPQNITQTQVPGMDPQVSALLGMIRVPFLTQIQDQDLTGTDFAGWFVDGFGQDTHDQIVKFGPDALFAAICSYPPIANDLAAMAMQEVKVRQFITEFCYPKWDNEQVPSPGPTLVTPEPKKEAEPAERL